MKEELADECDYAREASFLRSFGSPERLGNDTRFKVRNRAPLFLHIVLLLSTLYDEA